MAPLLKKAMDQRPGDSGFTVVMIQKVDPKTLPPSTLDQVMFNASGSDLEVRTGPTRHTVDTFQTAEYASAETLADAADSVIEDFVTATLRREVGGTIVFPLVVEGSAFLTVCSPFLTLPGVLNGSSSSAETCVSLTVSVVSFVCGVAYDLLPTLTSQTTPDPTGLETSVDLTGNIGFSPALGTFTLERDSLGPRPPNRGKIEEYTQLMTCLLGYALHNTSAEAILLQYTLKKKTGEEVPLRFLAPIFRGGDRFWVENNGQPVPTLETVSRRFDLRNLVVTDKLALGCCLAGGVGFWGGASDEPSNAYDGYTRRTVNGGTLPLVPTAASLASVLTRNCLESATLFDHLSTKTTSALAKVLHQLLFLRAGAVLGYLALPSTCFCTRGAVLAALSLVDAQRAPCLYQSIAPDHLVELADRIRFTLSELHLLESLEAPKAPTALKDRMREPGDGFTDRPDRKMLYANIPNPEVRKALEEKDNFIDMLERLVEELENENTALKAELAQGPQPQMTSGADETMFNSIFNPNDQSIGLSSEKEQLVRELNDDLDKLVRCGWAQQASPYRQARVDGSQSSDSMVEQLRIQAERELERANAAENEAQALRSERNADKDTIVRMRRELEDLAEQLERVRRAGVASPSHRGAPPSVLPQISGPSSHGNTVSENELRLVRQKYEDEIHSLREKSLKDLTTHREEIERLKEKHREEMEILKQAVKDRYIKERDREYARMKKQLEEDYLLKVKELKLKVREAMLGQGAN